MDLTVEETAVTDVAFGLARLLALLVASGSRGRILTASGASTIEMPWMELIGDAIFSELLEEVMFGDCSPE